MDDNEIGMNFKTGEVLRGDTVIMSLDEMLFLLDSAVRYNNMFPIEQSEQFVAELRERIGVGFTREQFAEIKLKMHREDDFDADEFENIPAMKVDYEKILITVIVNNKSEIQKYLKLFKFMSKNKVIIRTTNDTFETNDSHVRFLAKNPSIRGVRSHFVLNLTQDKEYDEFCVAPMTIIHDYLDREYWKELFE